MSPDYFQNTQVLKSENENVSVTPEQ